MKLGNPFQYSMPAGGMGFTDREEELAELRGRLESPPQRLLFYGRRRMGKTSLLKRLAAENSNCYLIDLSYALSLEDISIRLLKEFRERTGEGGVGWILSHVRSIRLGPAGIEFQRGEGATHLSNFQHTLDAIHGYARKRKQTVTLIFDEFQEIRRLAGQDEAEWQLRSIIQEHEWANYLFSGSDHRLVEWMSEQSSAFYKQLELMKLGPIDAEYLERWLIERASLSGVDDFPGKGIVEEAGPATGDIIQLARVVYELMALPEKMDDPVSMGMERIALGPLSDSFALLWRDLKLSQKQILRVVAQGRKPSSTDTLRAIELPQSTAHSALRALIERGLIIDEGAGAQFDNPFFRKWVLFGLDPT